MKYEDLTVWQKGLRLMANKIKPSRSDVHSLNPQSSILNPYPSILKTVSPKVSTATHNILVIGPSWIGDMMMAHSLFQWIKKENPTANIDVLAPAWSFPLLKCMPEVREPIEMPLSHGKLKLVERYLIGKALRAKHYNQAIVLPNSWKSALIPWFARIPKRTGWLGEMRYGLLNDLRALDQKKYPLMVERYLALGMPKGNGVPTSYAYPKLTVTREHVEQSLLALPFLKERISRKILALCPGAQYGPAKNWPEESYAEVANAKLNEGWDVWIFGSKRDIESGMKIQRLTDNRCVNLAGRTSMDRVIGLLSLAKMVVTNDSGLMHVACALDIPLVAIYGSSSPRFTPPLSHRAEIVSLRLKCNPCFKKKCPKGHYRCLKNLPASLVLETMKGMVGSMTN